MKYLKIMGGNDTLTGGAGNDTLIGGSGYDTYYAGAGDTLGDSDGKGTVFFNDQKLTFAKRKQGETAYTDAAGNSYVLNGSTLTVNDTLTINHFRNKALGIYLDAEDVPPPPGAGGAGGGGAGGTGGVGGAPVYNPADSLRRWDPLVLDLDGNGQIDTANDEAAYAWRIAA